MSLRVYDVKKVSSNKVSVTFLVIIFLAVALVLLIRFCFGNRGIDESVAPEHRYDKILEERGAKNGVDPDLLRAVIWRETGGKFDPNMKGAAGEVGLMQIMQTASATDWANEKKRSVPTKAQLSDPELNIEIGSWYLGRALHRWRHYKDAITLALCEYNAGYGNTKKWRPEHTNEKVGNRIRIESTQRYVGDILLKYKGYQQQKEKAKLKKGK